MNQHKKQKFLHAAFNDMETLLALADCEGNIFVIEMETEKYQFLIKAGIATLISFPVLKRQELLIGLNTNFIVFCCIENGEEIHTLKGHTAPPTNASYYDSSYHCLTSSAAEAIVWDLLSYTQIHRLSLKPKASLKKAVFIPITHQILACFQDDIINIWELGTFECIKQIIPEKWKTHDIRDIAITQNGRIMVLGGYSHDLIIFCLDSWIIKKIIKLPENISGIKQLLFIPQVFDGGANKILVLLTTSLDIFFFDIETSTFLNEVHLMFKITTDKIAVSNSGKYLATIFTTGTVNIYALEKIFNQHFSKSPNNNKNKLIIASNFMNNFPKKNRNSNQLIGSIKKELTKLLDLEKILPILIEYGEYPELYRILIWKTILKLPENQKAFVALSSVECHHSYYNLASKYPSLNKSLCNSLKKLLSNLSRWCPLFGEVSFLPEFIFPFVKLFHSDPLGCFEVVATVIVNWCQNWFEFYPFPPINMLYALENILNYHDSDLLEFYIKNNITSSIYICPLFHTAFSEVLSKLEWLKFWDHVISNEPSFLFLAIIAYNVVNRNAIKRLNNIGDIEAFFRTQNPTDVKKLIAKTYYYVRKTPHEIHCRQFFIPFRPLTHGTYLSFSAYPKLIVNSSVEKLHKIRKEKEDIFEKELKAMKIKQKLDTKMKTHDERAEKEKIYQELENKIREVVEQEEYCLLNQKQKLRNLKRELRKKELEIFEKTANKILMERQKRNELELERLVYDTSKRRAREKIEVDIYEEEMQKYYAQLLLKQSQLALDLEIMNQENKLQSDSNNQRASEHESGPLKCSKIVKFANKLKSIKKLIDDFEIEMVEEAGKDDKNSLSTSELKQLQFKVKDLEKHINKLLLKNFISMQQTKEKKSTKLMAFDELPLKLIPTNDVNQADKKNSVSTCKKTSSQDHVNIKEKSKGRQVARKSNQKQRKLDIKFENSLKKFKKKLNNKKLKIHQINNQELNSEIVCNNKFESQLSSIETDNLRSAKLSGENKKLNLLNYDSSSMSNNQHHSFTSDYLFQSDSENEIFKTAWRIRKQLLQMTKRKQKVG